jgi:GWxTD domain-containing protein
MKALFPKVARIFRSATVSGGVSLLFLSLMICLPTCDAQTAVGGKGSFEIAMDVSRFYGDSSQSYVEIYYGIREKSLSYTLDSGRFTGAANVTMEIRNDSTVVAKKEWTVPHILADTGKLNNGQQLMGIESVGLPPGKYLVSLSGYDVRQTARRDSTVMPLMVEKYPDDREAISDIEYCTLIQQSTNKASRFYKNTLEVIPNAARLYGTGLPIIYYYFEVYNLIKSGKTGGTIVHTAVADINGNEVLSHDKQKPRAHNSSVEIGTMNINSLRGGTYVFRVVLLDSVRGILASSDKKFYVYKPGSQPDSAYRGSKESLAAMDFYAMSDSAVTQEFEEAKYLATDPEQVQFLKLTDTRARQKYLYEFWQRRNPDTATLANPYRDQYLQRVDYANKNLTVAFHPGWKTDRGRVYIVYGPSDEIERFANSDECLPYEIWHYNNLQGGVIFVFVDRSGTGLYELVHSTYRTELQDPDWYEHYAQRMH